MIATVTDAYVAIREHFSQEGARFGYDRHSTDCVYRRDVTPYDAEGNALEPVTVRCAVGCLIPDGDYDEMLEGKGISCDIVWEFLVQKGIVEDDPDLRTFLQHTQDSHDGCASDRNLGVSTFLSRLDRRAREMGVPYSIIDRAMART